MVSMKTSTVSRKKPHIETKDSDTRPDEIVAAETWENHLKRNKSKIQELMHGQYKSTLDCPDCKRISITFDPYMMISLPIPNIEFSKFFAYFIYTSNKKLPSKINLILPSNATAPEIAEKLSGLTKVPANSILLGLVKEHRLVEFVEKDMTAHQVKEHPGILFAYEMPETATETGEKDGGIVSEEARTPIKVFIIAEPKAFYESDKTISYSRLIFIDPSETLRDVYIKVFEKLRPQVHNYYTKQNMPSPVNLEDKNRSTIEAEYDKLFNDENESKWIYKLFFKDENPVNKAKSKPLSTYDDKEKFSAFLQKNNTSEKHMTFEAKITKNTKTDNLGLNQCTELSGSEGDEPDPSKGYNVYDCFDSFTKKEKLEKGNEWYCNKCKEHKQAAKKMEIYKAPQILVLHLKRFKTSKVSNIGSFYFSHGSKKLLPLLISLWKDWI